MGSLSILSAIMSLRMLILIYLATFLIGLILIYLGSEWLISAATKLGQALQWSNIAVGFIVIGIGTSMPEIAISLYSVFHHHDNMLLGNIIGSNISNCLLVFGVSLLSVTTAHPPKPNWKLTFYLSALTLIFVIGLLYGYLPRALSTLLFILGVLAVLSLLKRKNHNQQKSSSVVIQNKLTLLALIIVNIILVLFSAKLIIDSGHVLAMMAGINEGLFAMLFIGIGNSLPEIAMVLAAMRHQYEGIVIGNILGSNVCNIAFAVGLSGMIRPLTAKIDDIVYVVSALLFSTFIFLSLCYLNKIKLRHMGFVLILLFISIYLILFAF